MTVARAYLVAIDTMILVWGLRRAGQEEQIKRADWLIDSFDENNVQVIVPSVCLAEYLIPCDPATHNDTIAELAKRFILAPFDARGAALAARLFVEGKKDRKMATKNARNLLKSDSLIIATAAVHGARTFYSDDTQCRSLASRVPGLTTEGLPTVAPDLWSL